MPSRIRSFNLFWPANSPEEIIGEEWKGKSNMELDSENRTMPLAR